VIAGSFYCGKLAFRPIVFDHVKNFRTIDLRLEVPLVSLGSLGVSEALCIRLSPCGFDGSSVEPFWV
jgi:hypothetical protein